MNEIKETTSTSSEPLTKNEKKKRPRPYNSFYRSKRIRCEICCFNTYNYEKHVTSLRHRERVLKFFGEKKIDRKIICEDSLANLSNIQISMIILILYLCICYMLYVFFSKFII
ncbi:uncharacterized protein LOC123301785 [Chrysoperla carnea]|uniref:uncharacterized protein LOC123301785 n=1 Tax=Chrysoperla carnea TaxID=189513 RepID=UPI001D067A2A|nr:uncharacterized protein LOC123301785 [Chrysoperla carnea]